MQSLQISWDAHLAPQANLADLSPAKIERFIRRVNDNGRFALETSTPLVALEKLNYLIKGQPTWAAMLLFAKEPCAITFTSGASKLPA